MGYNARINEPTQTSFTSFRIYKRVKLTNVSKPKWMCVSSGRDKNRAIDLAKSMIDGDVANWVVVTEWNFRDKKEHKVFEIHPKFKTLQMT